jgi:hypothetical protein
MALTEWANRSLGSVDASHTKGCRNVVLFCRLLFANEMSYSLCIERIYLLCS